jgi:D-beta-D-heptose 7-phosphate kinase/D-beta-D-heptose 1-phosphate adenosyltransferase
MTTLPTTAAGLASDLELAGTVRRFAQARVLVVGDIILDRYVSGAVQRLSPEAPIPVLRPTGRRSTLGGAANVALNVATLGGLAVLVGAIGNDAAGAELADQLAATPGITPALITIPDRPTTAKTRFMSGAHQLLRLDEETTAPLAPPFTDALLAQFERALTDATIVVLSDYAKGVLCDQVLAAILQRARAAGRTVIADPKRPDLRAYRGAAILTPNEHEVRAATRIDASQDAEADRAGRAALETADAEAVLVTRSA